MHTLDQALADLNNAAEHIWAACAPTCPGLSIEVVPHIASTNTELMARGRRGDALSPCFLAAALQTAGRGRQGRVWHAQAGQTLTFSLGLPLCLDEAPGGSGALSLAVGLAVAQTLDHHLQSWPAPQQGPISAAIGLKWPNDLCIGPRKLGGILIETTPAPPLASSQRWVVIGLGLNVRGQAPAGATALAHADAAAPHALSPGQVWQWVAPALLASVQAFQSEGFAPLQAAYAQRDVLRGQTVGLWRPTNEGISLDGPAPVATGVAAGIDHTGALLVHTDNGLQSWASGEVSVRIRAH